MASSMEKELAKNLECGICLDKFEEPKVLICQHLYCRKCLEKLVTRDEFEITCPECRRKTKVVLGDVTGLPSNFLINNLLSICGNGQSNVSPSCEKHDEILKLFCQSCDQLICRDCIVIDHREHEYTFVKEIFPAEKEKILKIVEVSRENIRALESSIAVIKTQDDKIEKNSQKVNQKLDSFIDKQIEVLERRRQRIKGELRESVSSQKTNLKTQMESFSLSLGCLKSSVELTEEALSRETEVEILSAKKQMIQQLNELNFITSDLKPRGRISYSLKTYSTHIDPTAIGKIAKIRENDEEYELFMRSGILAMTLSKHLRSVWKRFTRFCIRPKSESNTLDQANKVQVTIIAPDSEKVEVPAINDPDGSFNFSYVPVKEGDYKIEVLINGRYVDGSPFTWEVDKSFTQKFVEKNLKS